jgi:hypothetical protein
MTVSIFDLPKDDCEVLPAGKWLAVLADRITDSFGAMSFRDGVSTFPIDGRALMKACTFFVVDGVKRVEGEPCVIGDISRLAGLSVEVVQPVVVPVAVAEKPVSAVATPGPAKAVAPQVSAAPKNMAELEALDEESLRKLGAKHGLTDRRWSTHKLVRELADELNLAD